MYIKFSLVIVKTII